MQLNHVLICTNNLDQMCHFMENVIGLDREPRPLFPIRGAWFGSQGKAIIHVVEDQIIKSNTGAIHHVALEGGNYQIIIGALNREHVEYTQPRSNISGDRQVFIHGPDGLIVEMIFP